MLALATRMVKNIQKNWLSKKKLSDTKCFGNKSERRRGNLIVDRHRYVTLLNTFYSWPKFKLKIAKKNVKHIKYFPKNNKYRIE